MVSTLVLSSVPSDTVIGAAVVGCVVLAVAIELTDDERPFLARLSRHLAVFSIPLYTLFAFIVVVWGADIIA